MASLLLTLLHLFALILVVRLTLPSGRYVFFNPYAGALNSLLEKLLGFVRTAFPLRDKILCALLLALDLAACAAVLTRLGGPQLALGGGIVVGVFPARTFLGWLNLAVLDFLHFYLAVLSGAFVLRLWHRARPLPGYAGELLHLAARPFSGLRLPWQALVLLALSAAVTAIGMLCASGFRYPLDEIGQALSLRLPSTESLPALAKIALLSIHNILGVISQIANHIFLFWIILALAALFNAAPMAYFMRDVLRLLCGALPPLRLGPLDLSPLVAIFALNILYVLLTTLLGVLLHVV